MIFWWAVAVGLALNLIAIYLWDMMRKYEKAYLCTIVAVVDVLMATAVLKVLS